MSQNEYSLGKLFGFLVLGIILNSLSHLRTLNNLKTNATSQSKERNLIETLQIFGSSLPGMTKPHT